MLFNSVFLIVGIFAAQALAAPYAELAERTTCTAANAAVRKEWGSFTPAERKCYTDAVVCLQNLPSQLNSTEVPGAKSRYDDFLAVHINQTQVIHMSGFFLPWHRVFFHLYEEALKNECGYTGLTPYWDWPLWNSDLAGSPLFDGSEYSLSGDGAVIENNTDITLSPGVVLPHGSGGGCIYNGPFVNYTVPFRAFAFTEALTGSEPTDRFDYTPRCSSRDLNTETMADFLTAMNGVPGTYAMDLHGGGHFTTGPVGSDIFDSPGDPAFYLHHGQIDRVWTIWQALDPVDRQYALSGTGTFLNIPPSANVTLTDTMNWGILGPELTVEDAMSVTAGPFCYKYV